MRRGYRPGLVRSYVPNEASGVPWVRRPPRHPVRIVVRGLDKADHAVRHPILIMEFVEFAGVLIRCRKRENPAFVSAREDAVRAQIRAECDGQSLAFGEI